MHPLFFTEANDISPSILNNLLPGFKKIVQVVVKELAIVGMAAEVRRLQLKYQESTLGISPKSLVAKFGRKHQPKEFFEMSYVRSNEDEAYKLVARYNFVPQIYYSFSLESRVQFTILMQDLSAYTVEKFDTEVEPEIFKNVVRFMAKVHADNTADKIDKQVDLRSTFNEDYKKNFKEKDENGSRMKSLLLSFKTKVLSTDFKGTFVDVADFKNILVSLNLDDLVDLYLKREQKKCQIESLIHWDLHTENLMINEQFETKIIDWQLAKISNPVMDISKFLFYTLMPNQLKQLSKELIGLYMDEFQTHYGKRISQEQLKAGLYDGLLFEMHYMEQAALNLWYCQDLYRPFLDHNEDRKRKLHIIELVRMLTFYSIILKEYPN